MLTKKHSLKPGNWKYLLLIPALLGCSFLMARTNPEDGIALQGNQKTFKGNTFTWRESDTLYYDKKKDHLELIPAYSKNKLHVVTTINGETVYRNDFLQSPASFGKKAGDFGDYVVKEYQELRKGTPDSLSFIASLSVTLDKEGKVVYYEGRFVHPANAAAQQRYWSSFTDPDARANALLEKIISNTPQWKPATDNGKAINSFVNIVLPGC